MAEQKYKATDLLNVLKNRHDETWVFVPEKY